MSVTLPVEAMSRLQVSFKVCLPDGRISVEIASNPTPYSTRVSDLMLHFQGTHSDTGAVTFTVRASNSGSPETNSTTDDCIAPDSSGMSQYHNMTLNYLDLHEPSESVDIFSSCDPLSFGAPEILGDSSISYGYVDDIGPDSATPAIIGSQNPFTEPMDIFDDHHPLMTAFLNNDHENSLSQNDSVPTYIDDMATAEPECTDNVPNTLPLRPTSLRSAYNRLSSIAGMANSSPPLFVDTDIPVASPAELAGTIGPSPSESLQQDSPSSASSNRPRPFKCLHADCPLWFTRDYTRRVHMNIHLPRTARNNKFPCTFDGCSIVFSRKHDRLRHEVGNHGISAQWNCSLCNKYFSSQTTLERHILDKHRELFS